MTTLKAETRRALLVRCLAVLGGYRKRGEIEGVQCEGSPRALMAPSSPFCVPLIRAVTCGTKVIGASVDVQTARCLSTTFCPNGQERVEAQSRRILPGGRRDFVPSRAAE